MTTKIRRVRRVSFDWEKARETTPTVLIDTPDYVAEANDMVDCPNCDEGELPAVPGDDYRCGRCWGSGRIQRWQLFDDERGEVAADDEPPDLEPASPPGDAFQIGRLREEDLWMCKVRDTVSDSMVVGLWTPALGLMPLPDLLDVESDTEPVFLCSDTAEGLTISLITSSAHYYWTEISARWRKAPQRSPDES